MSPYQPENGNYDAQLQRTVQQTPGAVVGWILMASYAYYVDNVSLLSDTTYDSACKWLLDNYDTVRHRFKYLLPKECLEAGSAFHLKAGDYPHGIVRCAVEAANQLE